MKRLLLLLALAGCSKTASFSGENRAGEVAIHSVASVAIVAAQSVAPPPPRADCAAPSRLVAIGTLHERASFWGELLSAGGDKLFDPETFAPVPPLPPASTKIERRGGASITPSRYRDIVNGRGITSDEESSNVIVDLASGQTLFATDSCAQARFEDGWLSSTGRFFLCHTMGGQVQAWDLDSKPSGEADAWEMGEDVVFTPTDAYAVAAPSANFIDDEPRPGITYFDLDARKSKVVLKATIPIDPVSKNARSPEVPFDVELCGDGALFAATGDSEVAVFSGKDGTKLASVPSKAGGSVSFSMSGKYLAQSRGSSTTVYRLDL